MKTRIITCLLINFLTIEFAYPQCDEEFLDKQLIADTTFLIQTKNFSGYIFPENYRPFIDEKNEKKFTLIPSEIHTIEKILTTQYNEVHKNDSRVYGDKNIKNTRRYLRIFERQYFGFYTDSGEKSATIILANRKGRKKRHFECFDKVISIGMGEFYEKNQRIFVVNLDAEKLIIP